MVYLYLIAKIYKIQFLRVKVTRFYFERHGFPARENMSDIFQNTRHIFQNMCLVFFICSRGAPTRWKRVPLHGMEKPPYLPAFSVRVSAVRAAGRQGRLQKRNAPPRGRFPAAGQWMSYSTVKSGVNGRLLSGRTQSCLRFHRRAHRPRTS